MTDKVKVFAPIDDIIFILINPITKPNQVKPRIFFFL